MVRVENVKMTRLLAFTRHVEVAIMAAQKLRSAILKGSRTLLVTTGTPENLEKNRLAMSKTICVPDSSSLNPGSGAIEGVLD